MFDHDCGPHIPAESVYTVFEVKQTLCYKWFADASRKVDSVRRLRRNVGTYYPAWGESKAEGSVSDSGGNSQLGCRMGMTLSGRVAAVLNRMPPEQRLDLGCDAFEVTKARKGAHPFH